MTALLAVALVPVVVALVVAGLRAPLHVLLPAYAAFVPFGSLLSLPGGVAYRFSSVSSLLGLALTGALVLRLVRSAPAARRLPASVAVWVLFLGVALLTGVWSISPDDSLTGLLVLSSLVLLYVLVALSPVDRRAVRWTETGLLAGGLTAAAYGAMQAATGTLPTSEMGGERFGRDLLGANHTAAALILPMVIALSRSAAAPTLRSRLGHGAAVLLLLFGIALTGSRGGLVGAAVALVALASVGPRRRYVAGFGVLIVGAVAALVVLQPGGVGERATREGSSGRLDIWQVGLAACEQHCLTGAGWGSFPVVYRETQASVGGANVLLRGTSYEPHNVFMLVGVEAGLTALLLMLVGMALSIGEALRIPADVRGPPLAGLLGVLTTGVFLSNFEFKYFWMALMYVAICRHAVEAEPEPVRSAALSPLPR